MEERHGMALVRVSFGGAAGARDDERGLAWPAAEQANFARRVVVAASSAKLALFSVG